MQRNLELAQADATAAADAEEQKRLDAMSDAKNAEGNFNNYQVLLAPYAAQIATLEDEIKKGLPGTPGEHKAKVLARKQDEIRKLEDEKLELENLSLAAATVHTKFEQMADNAKNARDAFSLHAAVRRLEIPQAGAALDLKPV